MAALSGVNTAAALKINTAATNYGTAGAFATGDKIIARISPAFNAEELVASAIGSGNRGAKIDITQGNTDPRVTLEGEAGYENGFDRLLALFMGATASPAEQNGGQGDYLHRITFNDTPNPNYGTFAFESSSSTVIEMPSCSVTELTIRQDAFKDFLRYSATLLGNNVLFASTTNNNAAINSTATLADSELAVAGFDADFWLNAQSGGALSSGDQLDITSLNLSLQIPQSHVGEARGAAGHGQPRQDDGVLGTLQITFKENADNTYHTAWSAETTYKCRYGIEGTQIGSGDNKTIAIYCPRLKMINAPVYGISSGGFNPVTLTFEILQASANPTGLNDVLPYVDLTNERTTVYNS